MTRVHGDLPNHVEHTQQETHLSGLVQEIISADNPSLKPFQ